MVEEDEPTGTGHDVYVWSPADGRLVLADQRGRSVPGDLVYLVDDAAGQVTAAITVRKVGDADDVKLAERYVYDPYGNPTVLAADWSTPGPSEDAVTHAQHFGGPLTGMAALQPYLRGSNRWTLDGQYCSAGRAHNPSVGPSQQPYSRFEPVVDPEVTALLATARMWNNVATGLTLAGTAIAGLVGGPLGRRSCTGPSPATTATRTTRRWDRQSRAGSRTVRGFPGCMERYTTGT